MYRTGWADRRSVLNRDNIPKSVSFARSVTVWQCCLLWQIIYQIRPNFRLCHAFVLYKRMLCNTCFFFSFLPRLYLYIYFFSLSKFKKKKNIKLRTGRGARGWREREVKFQDQKIAKKKGEDGRGRNISIRRGFPPEIVVVGSPTTTQQQRIGDAHWLW